MIRTKIWYDYNCDAVNVCFIKQERGQRWELKQGEDKEPTWVPIDEGIMLTPFLKLTNRDTRDFLVSLADGLKAFGITPTFGEEVVGELKATKQHLNDMRQLVFKGKQVELSR